uniref:Methyltransferase FkbM domain-containing protein n=1 Tax=Acrobeloides nanus TaxID=290746 RepID=A0A914CM28_9BILA
MEYSLADLFEQHNDTHIEILKVDIEGAEYIIIDQLFKIPVCQIVIEVHGKITFQQNDPLDIKETLSLLRNISSHGFYFFSYEINVNKWKHTK